VLADCDVGKRNYSDPILLTPDHQNEVAARNLKFGYSINALVTDELVKGYSLVEWVEAAGLLVQALSVEKVLE